MDTQIRPVKSPNPISQPTPERRTVLSLPQRAAAISASIVSARVATADLLRDAILCCAAQAQTDEPKDTEARLHSFVAKMSGKMESLGELDLDRALWDLFGTPWPPAHSLRVEHMDGTSEQIAGM